MTTRKEAFEICEKLNPPIEAMKPMPYSVKRVGRDYKVIDLRTKKEVLSKED